MKLLKEIEAKILGSFSSGRCPICALLRQDEFDYLCDWVGSSNEKYRNTKRRIRLLKSRGFCNYHFWEFEKISSHYGSAEVSIELIEQLITILRTNEDCRNRHITCLVCSDLKQKESSYLNGLACLLKDDNNRKKYAEGWGLCYPHLLKILNHIKDASITKFLLKTELEQLKRVKSHAMELLRKKEPPLRWEQTDDEKGSYFRAIEKLVGRRGT